MRHILDILLLGAIAYFLFGLVAAAVGLMACVLVVLVVLPQMGRARRSAEVKRFAAEARLKQLEGQRLSPLEESFADRVRGMHPSCWEPTAEDLADYRP